MSLRPRQPGMARLARAQGRMAPGGRRWSESPIPRPGHRRMLLAPGPPPVAPVYRPDSSMTGLLTTQDCSGVPTAIGAQTGDVVILVVIGYIDPTPPTGWTVLTSGEGTLLDYFACWTVQGPSTDWYIPCSLPLPDATGYGRGAYAALAFHDVDPALAPVAIAAETVSATVQALPTPDPAWLGGFQVAGSMAVATEKHTVTKPDPGAEKVRQQYNGNALTGRRHIVLDATAPDVDDETWAPYCGVVDGDLTADMACEWVSIALGWAPA